MGPVKSLEVSTERDRPSVNRRWWAQLALPAPPGLPDLRGRAHQDLWDLLELRALLDLPDRRERAYLGPPDLRVARARAVFRDLLELQGPRELPGLRALLGLPDRRGREEVREEEWT